MLPKEPQKALSCSEVLVAVTECGLPAPPTPASLLPAQMATSSLAHTFDQARQRASAAVALAETFQTDRSIDRFRDTPYLTGLHFTRGLHLLDVAADSEGAWATTASGTFAMSTGPHSITQRWARRVVEAFPDLDGLRYNSRFAGTPCIALFLPAATAMPDRPVISQPLTHPGLVLRITGAAQRLGYDVI